MTNDQSEMPENNGTTATNGNVETEIDLTETDACLDLKQPKKTKLPFLEKYISNLQEKTHLTRNWVLILCSLVVATAIFLLVIIGMTIGWPKLPHTYRYPLCKSPECLRAAAQIQENLNYSSTSCTNLWESVCSHYNGKSARPLDRPVWNQKEILIQKESERLRNVISTLELPLHTGTVEWKLKHFYEACVDVDSIASDGARPLTNIISELGGWYILRDWNDEDFNGMQVLNTLQVRYGVSAFFKIHVEPDPLEPDANSIRISPSGLGLPDKEYYFRDTEDPILTAYTDYIKDVVISLSSTKNNAVKFGKDIFNYEKRLAEITPDLVSLQDPITTYNAVSMAELKHTTSTIPFYDILQAMYPEVSISDNTQVLVTSQEYLTQLSQIISSTDRRTMNGYLIWSLVRQYIPFLSENYNAAVNSFNNELFGLSKTMERWDICTGLVRKYMAVAAEYQLEKLYPVSDDTKKILNNTFENILKVVKKKVGKFDNTAMLKEHLKAKLNAVSIQIGLPQSTKDVMFLKNYYKSLKIIKLNLFESVKSAMGFQKKIEERMLLNTLPEAVYLKETLKNVPSVRYIPSKNIIVVPRSLTMEPIFENGYPDPIRYGRLGVEIASAILSSILPFGSLWTADKKILSPFHMTVNESLKTTQPGVDCLYNYILKSIANIPASRARATALNALKEISAVKIAHEALTELSINGNHIHYAGVEQYEQSGLYFLSFAQTQCMESTQEYDIYNNLLQFRLSSKSMLGLIWTQLADFPKAFDCDSRDQFICNQIF
ncbi:unnamed protein product [Ceutorhynchus assimilis]|uniref:Endothelin-converting enzyme 1 n=1 Tax=Ceutorhynchus assimilis TaxID=467358 RepID=A0A9N9QHE0_9CUCU|nr:unnamed protein product [Ceutorhynchus assimilis]